MATDVLQRRAVPRANALAASRLAPYALFGVLVAVSLVIRTRAIDAGFWIDEALTVGISSFPLTEIAEVLRQDGSPPLYYFVLHLWMDAFGTSETATHALSLVFALLAIPAALWAGWTLFGRREGWTAAALAALNPFLTIYAQETRMYSLVILLSFLATASFVHGFVYRRRRYVAVFGLVLAVMLYTHNWALFFAVGAIAALFVVARETGERRGLVRDAALAFGGAALAFVPWLPTLLFQAAHTGAPWSNPPSPLELFGGASVVLIGQGAVVALLLAGGSGLARVLRGPVQSERAAVLALIAVALGTLLSGWLFSQFAPAWANRYLGVLVGPVLLLAALGLPRAGRLGVAALVLVVLFWGTFRSADEKSNVREMAEAFAPSVDPGDLVISTQPEQVPPLWYYLPEGTRFASPLGPVPEPRVMDWRDALERLERSRVETHLEPLLAKLPVGRDVILVQPLVRDEDAWTAPWTSLVRERSIQWSAALAADGRFTRTQHAQPAYTDLGPRGVIVDVFTKTGSG